MFVRQRFFTGSDHWLGVIPLEMRKSPPVYTEGDKGPTQCASGDRRVGAVSSEYIEKPPHLAAVKQGGAETSQWGSVVAQHNT